MRLVRTTRLIATLAVVSLTFTLPAAHGDTKSQTQQRKQQVDSDIAGMIEDLAGTSQQLIGAYQRLAQARGRLPAAQAALESAKAAEAEAARKDAELAGRLAAAEHAQRQAQADVARSAEMIRQTRHEMGRLAAAAYRRGAAISELSVAMQANSPQDFAERFVLADSVLRTRGGTVHDLSERQVLQGNAQTRLVAVQVEVADLREQARQALHAAEAARAEAAARKSAVDTLIADEAAATRVIESRRDEEEARLAQLKAEQDKLVAELKAIAEQERAEAARRAARDGTSGKPAARSGTRSSDSGGTLAKPVSGRITSHYGYRIHPIHKTRRMHTGTDFGAACGTAVHASASGRVISAGWAGGYGNRIVVAHGLINGDSLATTYSHLSGYKVRSGRVSRGQLIGYVGTTGSSTGCHLHFEVLKNGSYVNPMNYL